MERWNFHCQFSVSMQCMIYWCTLGSDCHDQAPRCWTWTDVRSELAGKLKMASSQLRPSNARQLLACSFGQTRGHREAGGQAGGNMETT